MVVIGGSLLICLLTQQSRYLTLGTNGYIYIYIYIYMWIHSKTLQVFLVSKGPCWLRGSTNPSISWLKSDLLVGSEGREETGIYFILTMHQCTIKIRVSFPPLPHTPFLLLCLIKHGEFTLH